MPHFGHGPKLSGSWVKPWHWLAVMGIHGPQLVRCWALQGKPLASDTVAPKRLKRSFLLDDQQ